MDYQRSGLSLHSFILSQHGREVLKSLRSLEKINQILARWKNNCHFNTKCVHNNVVPKCLHPKSPIKGRTAEITIKKAERRLLNIAIAQGHFTIRKPKEEKEAIWEKISHEIKDDETIAAILEYTTTTYEMEFAATKDRQQTKFHKINRTKQQPR